MRTFVFHMHCLLLVFSVDSLLAVERPCPVHIHNNARGLETIIFMCRSVNLSSVELMHTPLLVDASYPECLQLVVCAQEGELLLKQTCACVAFLLVFTL